ncbi:dihydrofolate reductase family protein [Nocardiopsis sp. EMB25]|uniref:dihydrofolate reductase family protein n=1 Tax=Nocardiopsis sp. EMB25 TaxID=2835867 RepID=UPI0022841F0B|nr:dihydrofolate reductase family protein [Nocardiopsis sp. EMB25]MCY9785264.1 dihydrofolate reductase family protein [Nocardiopsis sp. EMB25]
MGTISVFESVTLDGVLQSVGRPDEDTRGGFRHGGWGEGYADEVIGRFAGASMGRTTAMLLGHRTYDDLLGHWTSVPEPNPFTRALLNQDKYVASRDAGAELAHPNSTLLSGEAAETVAALKRDVEGVITVLGSGELVRSLHAAGLVDEYALLIHPIVLGSGTRLFGDADRGDLVLRESVTSTTGVVMARYQTD